MRLLSDFFNFIVALLVLSADAASAKPVSVALVAVSTPTNVYESSVTTETRASNGLITYETTANRVKYTIRLSQPLKNKERMEVNLRIDGPTDTNLAPIESNDLDPIAIVTSIPTTRVSVSKVTGGNVDADIAEYQLSFIGAGTQAADLGLVIRDDNALESDAEGLEIVIDSNIVTTGTQDFFEQGAEVDSNADKIRITVLDDEYLLCLVPNTYEINESESLSVSLRVEGLQNTIRTLPRDSSVYFSYQGTSAHRATAGADYSAMFEGPPYLTLAAGTTSSILSIPIINDPQAERTESFSITPFQDRLPNGIKRSDCAAQVNILQSDPIRARITADQSLIDEGDTARFTLLLDGFTSTEYTTPQPLPTTPIDVKIRVSDMPGGDFIPPAFEAMEHTVTFNNVSTTETSLSLPFTFPTVNNNRLDTADSIRVEIIPSPDDYTLSTMHDVVLEVQNDDPQVSVDAPINTVKGRTLEYAININGVVNSDTSVTLEITENTEIAGKDFIDSRDEGVKTVVIPAGSTRITQTIPTNKVDFGNPLVFGRVDLRIRPAMGDEFYYLGSPATASIAILDSNCDYAIDVDEDDDGLIEICYLDDLNQVRYSLDGRGQRANRGASLFSRGCDENGDNGGICRGYELSKSLDFNDPNSYRSGIINQEWTEGTGWQPIGTSSDAFSGYFEGNDFTISNLYINRPLDKVALFGNTAPSAKINAVELSQVSVKGKSQVGSLVAVNEGIVTNINVEIGNVTGSVGIVGGLIGVNRGTVVDNTIRLDMVSGGIVERRCRYDLRSTRCAEAEKIAVIVREGNIVGGLIGDNDGDVGNNFVFTKVLAASQVGGLVGFNSGSILSGNETIGNLRSDAYAGGLAGYTIGSILGSQSSVDVIAVGNYAGGLVGYACPRKNDTRRCPLPEKAADLDPKIRIADSSASGNVIGGDYVGGLVGYSRVVIASSSASGDVSGVSHVGGLVGHSVDTVTDGTVDGAEISGIDRVGGLVGFYVGNRLVNGAATDIAVNGDQNIGGLVGTLGDTVAGAGVIVGSFASGRVSGNVNVGGLAGHSVGSQITGSTATVSVTAMGNNAEHVGGLVGMVENSEIVGNYASGSVTGDATKVGGLVGFSNNGTLNNNNAVGNVEGDYDVGGLVGSAENTVLNDGYATGDVLGTAYNVGGLIGYLYQSNLSLGYATGSVVGDNSIDPAVDNDVDNVGGLVGRADNSVIRKSHATNRQVSGVDKVGGLIGMKSGGLVGICYAQSPVQGVDRVGGLIGENSGNVATTYAAGRVMASGSDIGGLIGYNHASRSRIIIDKQIANSYWDTTATGIKSGNDGIGFTDLKAATAPGKTAFDAFYQWQITNWDFGTSTEYPLINDFFVTSAAPALISRIAVNGFTLVPEFDAEIRNYYVVVGNTPTAISLSVAASDSDTEFIVSKVGDETNAIKIAGSNDNILISLNASPTPTELSISRNYSVQILRSLNANVTLDTKDKLLSEGQTLHLNVANNIADIVPLSYTWRQATRNPLLMDGLYAGITVDQPNFRIKIPGDIVPLAQTAVELTLSVTMSDNFGNTNVASEKVGIVKQNNGTAMLARPTFIGDTSILRSNDAVAIATDPDGEVASDADKGLVYQWQYNESDQADRWIDIHGANDAMFDIGTYDVIHARYRLQISYVDKQGYENDLTSEATMPMADKDRDGLIDIYHLEDLNNLRHQLDGSGYRAAANQPTIAGGCPNNGCFGYELTRDLDFDDNDSYRNPTVNKTEWTVSNFNMSNMTGWLPVAGAFTGTFEGNGYTLRNLQINSTSTKVALFELLSGNSATIQNLGIEDANIVHAGDAGTVSGILVADMSDNALIINSYAVGKMRSRAGNSGGLVGQMLNSRVINSYAMVDVTAGGANRRVGALVGALSSGSQITNSYAAGSVVHTADTIGESHSFVGGLLGSIQDSVVRDSYAVAEVIGNTTSTMTGGLIGSVRSSTVESSYWNIEIVKQPSSTKGGIGKQTNQMKQGIAQLSDTDGVYFGWNPERWDFGTAGEYPVLKYTAHPNANGSPTCDAPSVPECGAIIASAFREGLRDLIAIDGTLLPPFVGGNYSGNIEILAPLPAAIRLIPIAFENDAVINIYDTNGTLLQSGLASGESSMKFEFTSSGSVRRLVIEVQGSKTVRRSITLTATTNVILDTRECSELSAYTEINYLEDLDEIRNNVSGRYCLMRDLDFDDPGSYRLGTVNDGWTLRGPGATGWIPIGTNVDSQCDNPASRCFSGVFDGNGFVISNLRINRAGSRNQGLFGHIFHSGEVDSMYTEGSGVVRDLGLSDVYIRGRGNVGALAGVNGGTIIGSYATGRVEGITQGIGGFGGPWSPVGIIRYILDYQQLRCC